jgi:hypothetical protein
LIYSDAEPQITTAVRLVTWVGLKLTADDVVNLRLALIATLPNVAGLVGAANAAMMREVTHRLEHLD